MRQTTVCLSSLFLPIAFKQIASPGTTPSPVTDFVAHEQLEGSDSEIAARLNTAYRKVLVVGKEVFVPPIYSSRRAPYQFHVKQLRLLHHLADGKSFDDACKEAEIGPAKARKFLRSDDYKEFAAEAIHDQAIQDGWTPRRVVVEIDHIYQGKKRVSEEQMDALKMMKDIIIPKKHDMVGSAGGVVVNLNFPVLPPDVSARLKALADEAATINVDAA
jgi:hypothetical protein